MAKYEYMLCLVMLVAVVAARRAHHPKFPYKFTERDYRNTKGEYTKGEYGDGLQLLDK